MTHKQFDDKHLEHMLYNAPQLTDDRLKDEVLKRLLADERLQDNVHLQAALQQRVDLPVHQAQPKAYIEPMQLHNKNRLLVVSSVAVVFVLTIAGSLFLSYNTSITHETSDASLAHFSSKEEDQAVNDSEETEGVMTANIEANRARVLSLRTSVYEADTTNAVVFRIGLLSSGVDSVPMTYIIPNEKIAADFGKNKPTTLQIYEKYAPLLDEEALGFANFHPFKGELTEEGETLVYTLPEKMDAAASASVTKYVNVLKDTFAGSEYKVILLKYADKPSKSISLTDVQHVNYYVYAKENGAEYLSPNFYQTYPTVTEALTSMREQKDGSYLSAVPNNVTYAVTEEEAGVVVTFDKPLDLTTMDAVRATQLIEAMMLTASSFDKKLRFVNVVQESWEGFDLTTFLPIPVGANKQMMP